MLTVLEIFSILQENKENKFNPYAVEYHRITKDTQNKEKFIPEKNQVFPFSNFVFHSERANLSLRVQVKGKVLLPDNNLNLPNEFETFQFKTFTIIRDGSLHLSELPVLLTNNTIAKLNSLDNTILQKINNRLFINLKNRNIAKKTDVKKDYFANLYLKSIELKAKQKVRNTLLKEYFEKPSKLSDKYSNEQIEYLKLHGVTDNGYSLYQAKEKLGITYNYTELQVKASQTTLPSLEKIIDKTKNKDSKIIELYNQIEYLQNKEVDTNDEQIQIHLQIKKLSNQIKRLNNKSEMVKLNFVENVMYNEYNLCLDYLDNLDYIYSVYKSDNEILKQVQDELNKIVFAVLINDDYTELFSLKTFTYNNYNINFNLELKQVSENI